MSPVAPSLRTIPPKAEELATLCHGALADARATVATAESLSGGLLGAALTGQRGSSAIYRGGVVAYALDLKHELLGVPEQLLADLGPVHADTAVAMAGGARDRLGATYGLSTTGVAGPEPHGAQPVGTVYVACVGPESRPGRGGARLLQLGGDRSTIRERSVLAALQLLLDTLRS